MMSGHVNKMLLTIGYDLVTLHYLDVHLMTARYLDGKKEWYVR
jgi:hypothetical protein